MNFKKFFQDKISKNQPVFFDGGMGTIIQALQAGEKVELVDFALKDSLNYHAPDELSVTNPELIKAIHLAYLKAGADIVTTDTFGATPIKLEDSAFKTEDIIEAAVRNAKEAIKQSDKTAFVALDVSSTGKLLEPMGPLSFDEAYENYKTTMIAGEKAGADLVIIETMSDLYETKAAVLAAKENTDLPIIVSATFQNNMRTLTGADALTAIVYLESLGADAAGFNCGGSLADAAKLTETMCSYASKPVLVQPNAGLPAVENGRTFFKVSPEEFAAAQAENYKCGALVLGGCCGTTPLHIQAMVKAVSREAEKPAEIKEQPLKNHTIICSYNECADIGSKEKGPVIIGERINPTGKKKFKQALLDNNMQYIIDEASNQINAGAHILDVNVGLPGIDEQQMMVNAVKLLQSSFRTPLQIDSSEPPVLEKALRYYNGKALINSVNGKKHVMEAVFPLVKKYGGTVVALLLDENGIPPTAEERLAIADRIFETAASYGISKRDIVIDSLTLTISSQQKEARETLRTIQLVKQKYGCKTVLGVSNISFGLPRREIINAHFFTQALAAGLDACIINPLSQDMMAAFRAFRAIAGFDENCLEYIENYANTVAPSQNAAAVTKDNGTAQNQDAVQDLKSIIINGFKDRSAQAAKELLKTQPALSLINEHIVPALDIVGKDFESGRKFLPQLLLSAETVSKAFEVIKAHLAETGEAQDSKGSIVIATVQGDVHDIGKNIVKAMLENYGYTVIDLGKNVPVDDVVKAVEENDIKLVGLSALMTTTVASMEQTIKALRQYEKRSGKTVKIMVGGAVLTADYAKKIDADFYSKDAMNSVEIAKEVFGA
ncbi:MAG: homocysteine S-methyltransferase family protein [Treponemataceae bacterium]|nr:homocysteine S-methyltransferase family protein [Treponemataceae bacterium]